MGQITEISGQLADELPTRGVPADEAAQAIRETLHFARESGQVKRVLRLIEEEGEGKVDVKRIAEALRD